MNGTFNKLVPPIVSQSIVVHFAFGSNCFWPRCSKIDPLGNCNFDTDKKQGFSINFFELLELGNH